MHIVCKPTVYRRQTVGIRFAYRLRTAHQYLLRESSSIWKVLTFSGRSETVHTCRPLCTVLRALIPSGRTRGERNQFWRFVWLFLKTFHRKAAEFAFQPFSSQKKTKHFLIINKLLFPLSELNRRLANSARNSFIGAFIGTSEFSFYRYEVHTMNSTRWTPQYELQKRPIIRGCSKDFGYSHGVFRQICAVTADLSANLDRPGRKCFCSSTLILAWPERWMVDFQWWIEKWKSGIEVC